MSDACTNFLDDLAAVVDGDEAALDRHLDHLAECDSCRDARHEANQVASALKVSGADYAPPDDMKARLLAAIAAEATDDEPATGAEPSAPVVEASTAAPAADKPAHRGRLVFAFAAAAALVVAGVTATRMRSSSPADKEPVIAAAGTGARITQIERAAADDLAGVSIGRPGTDERRAATVGDRIEAGSIVRTDERTRVELALDDGTSITLNHHTALAIDANRPRQLALTAGEIVADVAHNAELPANFSTPRGRVEVLGTRFALTATDDSTSVRVTRGLVRLHGDKSSIDVRPGEEGEIGAGVAPSVAPAIDLASTVAWSELGGNDPDAETAPAGIGELRAYRPGEKRDKDWLLSLARHKVTVRIVGTVARTEIEETFRNDSKVTLEGVYKFPLPADARIDRLALDVDGGFEEGAFVDKERAARIWRGVIRNAAPKESKRPTQEIIWVPGPWRDPALLEWQRGGRFELRIFPIPGNGERTIKLAYTQTIRPHGDERRYVYPLAHSRDQSNAVEKFDVDVQVRGADPKTPVRTFGYELDQARADGATRLAFSAQRFVPKGNLIVAYRLPDSKAELRAWSFRGDVAVAPSSTRAKKGTGPAPEVVAAQRDIAADSRPFAVLALRPRLPRWTEARPRDYVIVVDSSQSMVGERYVRATRLAAALIGEMDRRDRFTLLACDIDCRELSGELRRPSAQAATESKAWLTEITPAGASDLLGALSRAATAPALARDDGRDSWVLYIGDGMASVGHRRSSAIASEVTALAQAAGVSFTTVGIGGDADAASLSAIARSGGGHYVPWVPGSRLASAALSVLETTYGVSLRDIKVSLPAGMSDVAPTLMPTLRAGNELLIGARFTGKISGEVILEGKVGGKPYKNQFPLNLEASTATGNGFVPRLWAALTIERLELAGAGEDRDRTVAISKAFGVLSRHTSLLVLESEAMFKAFAVDRAQPAVRWSGEEDVEVVESSGKVDYASSTKSKKAPSMRPKASAPAKSVGAFAEFDDGPSESPARESRPPPPRGRGWQRMKRVWFRVGEVSPYDGHSAKMARVVAEFEAALRAEPDSRERHRALVQALAYTGNLDRAYQIASQWLERDRLDPEALGYMADILGRQGDRERSLRLLSGVVDIDPDSERLHLRLAMAYDRAGATNKACQHRIVLAELAGDDARAIAAAVRCERALGHERGATSLVHAARNDQVRAAIARAAELPGKAEKVGGQLVLDASWSGTTDLDLTIVTPQGTRLSWMGGRKQVVADSANNLRSERLGLRKISRGRYLVEVSRTNPDDQTPVRGAIEVRLLGKKHNLPFQLDGEARRAVGRLTVSSQSRLEPF